MSYDTQIVGMSITDQHYTPAWVVKLAIQVMGGIDCDPASGSVPQAVVNAGTFFNAEQDGLTQTWKGRVWCNPPGEKTGRRVKKFWCKLSQEVAAKNVPEFMWLAFNISHLKTMQTPPKDYKDSNPKELMERCTICVLGKRLVFTGDQPVRDNALLYYGPNREKFEEVFRPHGAIYRGCAVDATNML